MIVQPDFPDHWKVQLLVRRLESEEAVRCLLRLWAHCQQRQNDVFAFTPDVLASICQWKGASELLWKAMTDPEAGWLEGDRERWKVRDWRVVNKSLVANWTRNPGGGKKNEGGEQPPKAPKGKPPKDASAPPMDNPTGEAAAPPIREEKRREDGLDGADGANAAPAVDWPAGFPETEEKAVGWVAGLALPSGVPEVERDFILEIWRKMPGIGFKDGSNRVIAHWGRYVLGRWADVAERNDWLAKRSVSSAGVNGEKKKRGGAGIIVHKDLPEPPCDWWLVLDALYPPAQFPDLDRKKPWGLYQPDTRREMEAECRRRGMLPAEWRQPPVAA